jgi:BMFP domain-containing protein YqiC
MTDENKQPTGDIGRMLNTAVSGITGMFTDVKSQLNEKIESYVAKMDLVKREEFEVVKEMLAQIQKDHASLKKKLTALEKND